MINMLLRFARVILFVAVPPLALIGAVTLWQAIFTVESSPPTFVLCPLQPVAGDVCQLVAQEQSFDAQTQEMSTALRLTANQVALVRDFDGSILMIDSPGVHPYSVNNAVIYPLSVVTYKTERENTDPSKCPGAPIYCDTPIDNVIFGNGTEGVIDLAITFEVLFNADNNITLYRLGGVSGIISLMIQEVRNYRALMSNIPPLVAPSSEGHEAIRQVITEGMAEWDFSHLLDIREIQIRSIEITDATFNSLRATQQAADTLGQLEVNRRDIAATQIVYDRQATATQSAFVLQLESDQAALNQQVIADKLDFDRQQQLADAQTYAEIVGMLCKDVAPDDCVDLIWIYTFGSQYQPLPGRVGEFGILLPTPLPTPTRQP